MVAKQRPEAASGYATVFRQTASSAQPLMPTTTHDTIRGTKLIGDMTDPSGMAMERPEQLPKDGDVHSE